MRKCVKKRKIEYPKINEMSNKKLKTCIPTKWIKLGVTSCLFNILIQNKVFAVVPLDDISVVDVTPGLLPYNNPIYYSVKSGCNVVSLISALTFIMSIVMIISKKSKSEKQERVSKKIKIISIISIILFILSKLGIIIVNYLINEL